MLSKLSTLTASYRWSVVQMSIYQIDIAFSSLDNTCSFSSLDTWASFSCKWASSSYTLVFYYNSFVSGDNTASCRSCSKADISSSLCKDRLECTWDMSWASCCIHGKGWIPSPSWSVSRETSLVTSRTWSGLPNFRLAFLGICHPCLGCISWCWAVWSNVSPGLWWRYTRQPCSTRAPSWKPVQKQPSRVCMF